MTICPYCGGIGQIQSALQSGASLPEWDWKTCSDCDGAGEVAAPECHWCQKPSVGDHPIHSIPWCGDCEPPLVECDVCGVSEVAFIVEGRSNDLIPMAMHLSDEGEYVVLCAACLEDVP